MKDSFKYKYDKKLIRGTILFFMSFMLAIYLFDLLFDNRYLAAWALGVALALTIFALLSIPRYLNVSKSMLEIQCLLELTQIPLEDIASVEKIEKSELKWTIPIISSCGFCGYFGYYIDLKNWNIFKIYTSSWDNLVVIENIYEDLFIVNCQRQDEFIAMVRERSQQRREQVEGPSASDDEPLALDL